MLVFRRYGVTALHRCYGVTSLLRRYSVTALQTAEAKFYGHGRLKQKLVKIENNFCFEKENFRQAHLIFFFFWRG